VTSLSSDLRSPSTVPGMLRSLLLEERRRRDRERQRRTRERRRVRRGGGVVVEAHVAPIVLRGLEQVGLLDEGDRTPKAVAQALARYAEASLYEVNALLRHLVLSSGRESAW
jgi:hypothetical protein